LAQAGALVQSPNNISLAKSARLLAKSAPTLCIPVLLLNVKISHQNQGSPFVIGLINRSYHKSAYVERMNAKVVSETGSATKPIEEVTSAAGRPSVALSQDLSNEPIEALANSDQRLSVLSNISQTLVSSLKWCPTSEQELAKAESDLLAVISRPFRRYFVDIGPGWGLKSNKIRTLEMLTDKEIEMSKNNQTAGSVLSNKTALEKQPLVMVHGFAAGIGIWILNLDWLAQNINRKIYAFDLIGFARSTRAPFDMNGDIEGQFVESIEKWRVKMGIEKFILLGHSFGGYLSASYALRYPNRVSHVILADPWGIQDRQSSPNRNTYRFPIWVRVANAIFQSFNPLAVLRATGPYGPSLVHKFRADLKEKFRPKLHDDCHKFLNYIYHCNAQTATGETAFKGLTLPYGWPKNPLIHRLVDLNESISLTFIYGSRSWIEKQPGETLRDCMTPNRVTVHEIEGSGHHVYADKYKQFNEIVKETCSKVPD
jgi:abhydrolase domain-containing protein 5